MSRPKKSPRVRVQIVFERTQAKILRAFCKQRDLDISQVVRRAVDTHLEMESVRSAEFVVANGLDDGGDE